MGVVIAPFRYAADGFTVEQLVPGDERDFGSVEAGLVEAGFVAGPDGEAAPADPAADAPVRTRAKRA